MIGERIKELRIKKNVTQETLANHLYISPQAVSKWEQGITVPDTSLLIPIADYFNVTVDYLLRDKENKAKIDISNMIQITIDPITGEFKNIGHIKNISNCIFDKIYFKIRFKGEDKEVLDYQNMSISDMSPGDTKEILILSSLEDKIKHIEIEIVDYTTK